MFPIETIGFAPLHNVRGENDLHVSMKICENCGQIIIYRKFYQLVNAMMQPSARSRRQLLIQSPSVVVDGARCKRKSQTRLHGGLRSASVYLLDVFFFFLRSRSTKKTLQKKSSSIIRSAMNKKRMETTAKNEKGINAFSPLTVMNCLRWQEAQWEKGAL